jgi:hypothetical protein
MTELFLQPKVPHQLPSKTAQTSTLRRQLPTAPAITWTNVIGVVGMHQVNSACMTHLQLLP